MDDEAIQLLVTRLARPHRSGGHVIERSAILAAGPDSEAILAWIAAHDGAPEAAVPAPAGRGLHSSRLVATSSVPSRYLLPPGVAR